ncbi:MAG: hypothetical protein SXQ77_08890, partial [Halobacteria archaeon]|nr:hypothetical protein [Halobacteria archaeon]
GAFWASYWFWHITVVLVIVAVALVVLGYSRFGGALLVIASLALLRFTFGLIAHTGTATGTVLPVGTPWMFISGMLLYFSTSRTVSTGS